MNKEIPTRVINIERRDSFPVSWYECPGCRKPIGGSWKQKECPYCEQKILWPTSKN